MVGHCLGKAEVAGSNPARGSIEFSFAKEHSLRKAGFGVSFCFRVFSQTFEILKPCAFACRRISAFMRIVQFFFFAHNLCALILFYTRFYGGRLRLNRFMSKDYYNSNLIIVI